VRAQVRDELRRFLGDDDATTTLAKKWEGGKIEIWPKDPGLEAKEIPIDTFFHKIVMLRDRLRVLESKINGHDKLNAQDKIDLQQYITRCYGSLTTFNVLFKEKLDQFVGSSTRDD
jgi:hypothetical protein